MSQIFSENFLKKLDNFGVDLHKHATAIKYESVTPDLSVLCFITQGTDGNAYYFTFISYDFLFSIKHARKLVGKSFAKVIEFIPPTEKQKGNTELEQKSFHDSDHGQNYLLARTERPVGNSYWATRIGVMPGDMVKGKLALLTESDQLAARKVLASVIQKHPVSSNPKDFLDGWIKKTERSDLAPESIVTNDTNLGIDLYKNINGDWEAFYNPVSIPTVKDSHSA